LTADAKKTARRKRDTDTDTDTGALIKKRITTNDSATAFHPPNTSASHAAISDVNVHDTCPPHANQNKETRTFLDYFFWRKKSFDRKIGTNEVTIQLAENAKMGAAATPMLQRVRHETSINAEGKEFKNAGSFFSWAWSIIKSWVCQPIIFIAGILILATIIKSPLIRTQVYLELRDHGANLVFNSNHMTKLETTRNQDIMLKPIERKKNAHPPSAQQKHINFNRDDMMRIFEPDKPYAHFNQNDMKYVFSRP
jgi:hypothetical protein